MSPEQEFSPEQWEALKMEAGRIIENALALRSPESSDSLRHIVGNLSNVRMLIEDGEGLSAAVFARVETNVDYLKRYLALLEDHPDFAQKEKEAKEGAFPDLIASGIGARQLVEAYEQKLKENPE
jgi:hypothetical protein